MADNKADGSIVIDTGLDTKGFDKGSKELLTAINSLTKEIERLGQTLQTTFSNYGNVAQNSDTKVQKLEQTVVQLEARVQELNATIAEMEEKLADASQQKPMDADAFEQTGASADDAKGRIAQLEEQISSLESYIDQLHAQMASGSDTIAPVMDTNQIYDGVMDLDEAFKTLESDMTDLEAVAEQAFAGDNAAVQEFKEGVSDAQSKIAEMERALEGFGATQIPTEDYAFLQSEYDKCDKKLEKLLDKQARMEDTGVKKNSKAWKNLQYDIKQTRVQMDTYKDDMAEMENTGTAFTLGSDTAEFAGYYKQLMEAKQALEELAVEVQQFGGQVKSTWANMTTLSGMLKNAFSSVGRAVMTGADYAVQAIRHPIQSLDRLLGGLVKTAGRVAGSLAKMAGSAIKGGFSRIASLAKKAATSLLGIGSGAKKSDVGLKNGLKTVLKYAFGIRSLYVLCNKLKSAIKDGFGSLAQYSPQVNSAVSSMQGALSTLKLSLSTAFAPIVTAVAPAITYLINLLTAAVNAIGMFFAAITGQKTYTKATAQVADYAASQSDAASSTGDAADAAKEEKKQLASFDDLDILEDSSSGGGGSGGGPDPSTMFETVPVDSGIAGFAQKIKELFEEGDYEEIGRIIAQKINEAFAKVKELIAWENVGAVVTEYVNAFCRIFNSLVDNIDWDLIGSTFAEGINTLLHTIELLLTGIDWSNFGTKIGEGLNGMVRDIEWDLLGETLAAYFSAKLNLLTSAVQEFDWGQLGSKMSEGVNSLVSTVITTITAIDWKGIGSNFITGVNNLVTGVNWTEVGNLLAQSFNAALGMIYSVVTDFKWSEAGKKFGEGVNGIISNVNWADIGQTISNSLTGALNFLFNAIKEINWSEICQALFEALGAALAGLSQFLGGLFGDAVEGLLQGILDVVSGIKEWIKEHVTDPIKKCFEDFSLAKLLDTALELGDKAISVAVSLTKSGWKTISSWVGEIGSKSVSLVKSGWKTISSWVGEIGSKSVSLVKSGWITLSSWVGEIGSKAVSLVKSGWTTLRSWVGEIGSKSVSLIKSGWTTLRSWVGEIGSKAVSLVKSGWKSLSSWVGTKVSVGISLVKSGWRSLSSWIGTKVSVGVSLFKSGWRSIRSFFGLSSGGIVGANGGVKLFASGGSISRNGVANWWNSIPKYANGTNNAHGTVFVAGEAGPEIVGNVNGKTEVLNKSQLAATMYAAIVNGLSACVNPLWSAVSGMMANCTNAIIASMAYLAEQDVSVDGIRADAISGSGENATLIATLQALADRVAYQVPIAATGAVSPYGVKSAASSTESIKSAIDASNDELISVVMQSVTNATTAIVGAIQTYSGTEVNLDANSLSTAIINEINRRTRAYGQSPLVGV